MQLRYLHRLASLLLIALLASMLYMRSPAPMAHASRIPAASIPAQRLPIHNADNLRRATNQARPQLAHSPLTLTSSATLSTTVTPVLNLRGAVKGAMRSVTISDTYALVRDYDGLTIFDVSYLSTPVWVAHLTLPPVQVVSTYPDWPPTIKVRNGIAYLLATYGFDIVDVRDPAHPTRLASYTYLDGWPPPWYISSFDLAIAGSFVYLDGRRIIDVSDPLSPTLRGTFSGGGLMTIMGDRAYALSSGRVQIFDIHNPAAPAWRGDYSYTSEIGELRSGLAVVGSLAYVAIANAYSGGTLLILDVSDPLNIVLRGKYQSADGFADVDMVGHLAYLRTVQGQVQIVDLGDPAKPLLRGHYDAAAIDLAVVGGTVYAVSGAPSVNGLEIIGTRDPAHPQLLGRYNTLYDPTALAIVDNLAYLGDSRGLTILDISEPTHPAWVGYCSAAGSVSKIAVDNNIAYMAVTTITPTSEIQLVDVGDPAHPTLRGRYPTAYDAISRPGFMVSAGMLYLGHNGVGLEIVDVRNPDRPTLRGRFADAGAAYRDMRVDGEIVYAVANGELQTFDTHNPAAPRRLARLKFDGPAVALEIKDGLAYLFVQGLQGVYPLEPDQFHLLDLADPSNPTIIGSVDIGFTPYNIRSATRVADGSAYILNNFQLQIVDVHDPGHLATYQLAPVAALSNNNPQDIQVDDNLVYLVTGKGGFLIFQRGDATAARVPPTGGMFASHAGAISYTFASGTFSTTATVAITEELASDLPTTGSLIVAGPAFEATAIYSDTGALAAPTRPYSLTVHYTNTQRGPAIGTTLGLYSWDGEQWIHEPGSTVDLAAWTITATPNHFSRWAVLGETRRVYLPIVQRPSS